MQLRNFFIGILIFLQLGCIEDLHKDSEDPLPSNEFEQLSSYSLSNFDLANDVVYWEVRRGSFPESEWLDSIEYSYEDELVFSYDNNALNSLNDLQTNNLNQADSEYGFSAQCEPSYCPIYGVAILGDSVNVITSGSELLALFGTINTIAELHFWLWSKEYKAETYQEVDGGYLVVADWDNLCGTKGKDLVFVDYNGVITKQRALSREEYLGCA